MKFALLSRPRTQAILNGKFRLDGLPVHWHAITDPLNWLPASAERDCGTLSGGFDGGEMSISSFIRAKADEAPLLALPIFLKRGLVQRSLFCSFDSQFVSPEQLSGTRIGLVGYTSSMAVWMRGILAEEHKLSRTSLVWCALSSPPPKTEAEVQVREIPEQFLPEEIAAWEELDGYSHRLDRREAFLIYLLERGELDAVISFQTRIASKKVRPLITADDIIWSHYRNRGVYPINHLFVMREDLFSDYPEIGETLLAAFREARKLWVDYLPHEREQIQREIERLGWDPFAYRLEKVERTTLEVFIDYLLGEKMISEKLSVDKLFHQEK